MYRKFWVLWGVVCLGLLWLRLDGAWAELDAQTKEDVRQAVDEYLAEKEASGGLVDRWLPTLRGGKFSLGGEMELEFRDTENDREIAEAEPHLALDKLVLQPKVKVGDGVSLDAQLFFQPHKKAYVNEFHVLFADLPCPVVSYLDLGQFEREIKNHAHRTTEDYPLIGTAFWRDDEYAVSVGGEWRFLYWSVMVGDGFKLAGAQPAEDKSYKLIQDDRKEAGFDGLQEVDFNLGYRNDYGRWGKVDVLGFYVSGELSREDVEFLQTLPGYGMSGDDKMYRYGVGMDYRLGGWRLYGQYITAKDGRLERYGWYVQPSYKLKLPQAEYFYGYEFLLRYGELRVDLAPDPASSYTWDRDKITLALITDVYKQVKLKTEYYVNGEDTGDAAVDNDELLVQLEVKF